MTAVLDVLVAVAEVDVLVAAENLVDADIALLRVLVARAVEEEVVGRRRRLRQRHVAERSWRRWGRCRDAGIWLSGNGWPVSGSRIAAENWPARCAAEGSVEITGLLSADRADLDVAEEERLVPQDREADAPPNWSRRNGCFSVAK